MMQIDKTNDQAGIEPKDVDRYWHLHPMKTEENQGVLATHTQSLRRQRIRRAQYAAVGAVRWIP